MPDDSPEITEDAVNELTLRERPQHALDPQQGQQETKLDQHSTIRTTLGVEPARAPVMAPLGPPPPYQELYPVQPYCLTWTPPPAYPRTTSTPHWTACPHPDSHHVPVASTPNVHMIGGQIIQPARVPATVRWFFGTITFMMISSIICAFVYVLIISINFK